MLQIDTVKRIFSLERFETVVPQIPVIIMVIVGWGCMAYSGRLLSVVTNICGLGTWDIPHAKFSLIIYLLNIFVFFKNIFS